VAIITGTPRTLSTMTHYLSIMPLVQSINGNSNVFVKSWHVTCVCVCDCYRLRTVSSVPLQLPSPVSCLTVTNTAAHILVALQNANLIVLTSPPLSELRGWLWRLYDDNVVTQCRIKTVCALTLEEMLPSFAADACTAWIGLTTRCWSIQFLLHQQNNK